MHNDRQYMKLCVPFFSHSLCICLKFFLYCVLIRIQAQYFVVSSLSLSIFQSSIVRPKFAQARKRKHQNDDNDDGEEDQDNAAISSTADAAAAAVSGVKPLCKF